MPEAYPRDQLRFMLEHYGDTILDDPKRCRSLLSDLAPQYRLETNLLIAALEQKIVQQIKTPTSLIPIELHLERLAKNLRDAIGIEQELAYWAVESWALALNVIHAPVPKATTQTEPKLSSIVQPVNQKATAKRIMWLSLFTLIGMMAGALSVWALFPKPTNKQPSKPIKANIALTLAKGGDNISDPQQYLNQPEPNDAWTQNNLGDIYYYGYGVSKNYQTAVQWYEKAAVQGSALAQCNLGFMYANGYGLAKDYAKAFDWYRKAAEQGNADGQNSLGILYENGFGVAKDLQQAKEWYSQAALQGHYGAQLKLRSLLEQQNILAKQPEE